MLNRSNNYMSAPSTTNSSTNNSSNTNNSKMGSYQPGSIANIIAGLFGGGGDPYSDASAQLDKYIPQAEGYQKPFYDAGTNAIPQFQNWLSRMADPSKFINSLMDQYQESPYQQMQQQQLRRNFNNFGSASGLSGSSALNQDFLQQSNQLSSQGMNDWLNRVLGINTEYGSGQQGLINTGQNSANVLTQLLNSLAESKAKLAGAETAGNQNDIGKLISGIGGLFGL